jgi:hypothetical protein
MVAALTAATTRQVARNHQEVMAFASARSVSTMNLTATEDGWNLSQKYPMNGLTVQRAVHMINGQETAKVTWVWEKSDESDNQVVSGIDFQPTLRNCAFSWQGYVYYIRDPDATTIPTVRDSDKTGNFLVLNSPILYFKIFRKYEFSGP